MSAPAAPTSRSAASSVPGLETGHTQHGTHLWNGVVIYSDIHMYRDLQMSRLCTENLRSLHECFDKVMGTTKIETRMTAGILKPASLPSTGHENNKAQPKANTRLSSTSHFSPFNCCLSVIFL